MAATESVAGMPSEELWMREPEAEAQPLQSANKQESDNAPVDLGPAPRRLGPIQLTPDESEHLPARSRWSFDNLLENIPAEHKTVLKDIGRGCVMVLTTPVAFAGVGLYACGVIIEGIALVLKGVGSFGGMFLIRRRRASPPSPMARAAEAWV